MDTEALKQWMKDNGVTVQDMAYSLSIHSQTVYRFLRGESVHRSTRDAIKRFVSDGGTKPGSKTKAS